MQYFVSFRLPPHHGEAILSKAGAPHSHAPPSWTFFTPPLPPDYKNPFADRPTLKGESLSCFIFQEKSAKTRAVSVWTVEVEEDCFIAVLLL